MKKRKILLLAITFLLAGKIPGEEIVLLPSKTVQIPVADRGEKTQYNPDRFLLFSNEWMWTRVLLDFKLDIPHLQKAEKIESATLILEVASAENPKNVPMEVVSPLVEWRKTENLKYYGAPWPQYPTPRKPGSYRCKEGCLEYGWESFGVKAEARKKGIVEFDVTNLIREHVMFGRPWNGFLLRAGPSLIGWNRNRNAPWKWVIPASTVKLHVKTSGVPPKTIAALKYFPSAHLPPVRDPYIFLFYNWSIEANRILWNKYFKVMNTDGVFDRSEFMQKGILSLRALSGPQAEWLRTVEGTLNYYKESDYGIAIDEWQSVDDTKKRAGLMDPKNKMGARILCALEALRQTKKASPEKFLAVYWRGEDSMRPLAADGLPDLVISEGYTRLPRFPHWEIGKAEVIKHADWAKEDGYYNRTIIMHGALTPREIFPDYKRHFTPENITEEVRVIREKYPELPGSGIYCEYIGKNKKQTLEQALKSTLPTLLAYDKALHRYFVEPAPQVTLSSPAYEAKISTPKVHLKGEAIPKGGRKIIQYRWFVDNRLMAETETPEWIWDVRPEKPGRYILTLHAIDSGWNRAATQLPVTILK